MKLRRRSTKASLTLRSGSRTGIRTPASRWILDVCIASPILAAGGALHGCPSIRGATLRLNSTGRRATLTHLSRVGVRELQRNASTVIWGASFVVP
jgi:DNA-binding IclR family transcriptional regulator